MKNKAGQCVIVDVDKSVLSTHFLKALIDSVITSVGGKTLQVTRVT